MCGGCWEPHAKMNNNRLLVTIAHEHTRRPSPRRLPPHLPLFLPWHAQTALPSWFTNTLRFNFTPLSPSHHSPRCNTDIWAEGHTAHSTLPRCARDPLSARSLQHSRWKYVSVCTFVCTAAKTTETSMLVVRYRLQLLSADSVNVFGLRQICGELYRHQCLLRCNQQGLRSKCGNIICLVILPSLHLPKRWIWKRDVEIKLLICNLIETQILFPAEVTDEHLWQQ